jgi:hypothetical protein
MYIAKLVGSNGSYTAQLISRLSPMQTAPPVNGSFGD